MDEGAIGDTGPIDFPLGNIKDEEWKVDASALALAGAFNAVALPANLPDHIRSLLQQRIEDARQTAIESGFAHADANVIDDPAAREAREKANSDALADYLADIANDEKRRREEEWDRSRVAIGNVTISGEEWDEAHEILSDPRLRAALVWAAVKGKGWTQERAEKAADDALTLAQIAQKEKDGTITAADKAKAEDITRRNPDAAVMVKDAAELNNQRGYGSALNESRVEQSALAAHLDSALSRKDEIAAAPTDPAFSAAPDLVSRFDAARSAPAAKPVQLADVKVTPVNPGLDLNATF